MISDRDSVKRELEQFADPVKAAHLDRFFKAFPGGYGEGDLFFGVPVPRQRAIARQYYREMPLAEVEKLLQDPVHECRLTALFILCLRFEKALQSSNRGNNTSLPAGGADGMCGIEDQKAIVDLYLRNLSYINNWDLVDSSADKILGPYLIDQDKRLLWELVESGGLWKQRAAVLTTYHFIKKGCYSETLQLAERLLDHEHDLIHKAVGWMLREIGNRDHAVEFKFLQKYYRTMPRTMLRYAIEKFDPALRQDFLQGLV